MIIFLLILAADSDDCKVFRRFLRALYIMRSGEIYLTLLLNLLIAIYNQAQGLLQFNLGKGCGNDFSLPKGCGL